MKVVTASTPWHSLNLEWARGVVGAHWISMAGKEKCPLSFCHSSPHTNISYKTLKRETACAFV